MSDILVVDYDKGNSRILTEILTEAGHKVYSTHDSVEAVSYLNSQRYDLVLTEMNMPDMDGIDLLRMIKEKWKNKEIPVIFVAEKADVKTTFMAINEGARDLIVKPFDPHTILDAVSYVLDNHVSMTAEESGAHLREKLRATDQGLHKNMVDIKMLDDISKEISQAGTVTDVCWTVLNMVQQLMEANRIALAVYNRQENSVAFVCTYADDTGVINELTPIDKKIQSWVIQHKSELLIGDLNKDYKYAGLDKSDQQPGSLLAVPMMIKNSLVGYLTLFKNTPNYFSKEMVRFLMTLGRIAATAIDNVELSKEVQKYLNGTIRALIAAVEAKDEWALGHAARVGRYALMMAKEMGLPKDDIRQLEYLALLHDIGMIGVPESLLKRKGQLTPEEWAALRKHTEIGANIVHAIEFIKDGARVIKHHHEWYNGEGYPDGLKGEAIPLFSRMIGVAEAFDSMTSTTCYREPIELAQAVVELKAHAAKQFDPELVAIFLMALKKEKTL